MRHNQRLPLVYDDSDETDPEVILYLDEIDRRATKVRELMRKYPHLEMNEINRLADVELQGS